MLRRCSSPIPRGSARLWDTQHDELSAAIALLDRTLVEVVAAYDGVGRVQVGEGDSFVVASACVRRQP